MKFIVSYNKQFDIDGKIETFEGFSLKYLIHKFRYRDEFKIIDIEQFNSTKFSEEDIVIIAVFNRNKLQFQHKMITEKIKEMFGDNLYRKNTFLILGTHAEAQGNDVRGNEKLTNEEASDLVFNNLQKKNQKVKLLVDGANTYGVKKPKDNNTKLVSGNLFIEWAEELLLNYSGSEIFKKNLEKIDRLQDRDKLYTCLQRRPRQCRVLNLYNIHKYNLQDDGYFSMRLRNLEPIRHWKHSLLNDKDWKVGSESFNEFSTDFSEFITMMSKHGSYKCDDVNLDENQAHNLNPTHYLNSYFQVVAETLVSSDFIFFTEKIYKPIICGSPFFVLGNRGSIGLLKDMGFKTFSHWWDESYDDMYSHYERSKKVFSTIENFKTKSKQDLNIILQEQKEILVFNHNKLSELIKNDSYVERIVDTLLEKK